MDVAKSLVVKAMYERIFVAGILAGFEDTLEALMPGVDEELRRALSGLSRHIEATRLQLDPVAEADDRTASEPEEHNLSAR